MSSVGKAKNGNGNGNSIKFWAKNNSGIPKTMDYVKDRICILFFWHSHSHSHSHNDIGNVYLLFLSKASGTMTVTMTKKQDKNMILYTF